MAVVRLQIRWVALRSRFPRLFHALAHPHGEAASTLHSARDPVLSGSAFGKVGDIFAIGKRNRFPIVTGGFGASVGQWIPSSKSPFSLVGSQPCEDLNQPVKGLQFFFYCQGQLGPMRSPCLGKQERRRRNVLKGRRPWP